MQEYIKFVAIKTTGLNFVTGILIEENPNHLKVWRCNAYGKKSPEGLSDYMPLFSHQDTVYVPQDMIDTVNLVKIPYNHAEI